MRRAAKAAKKTPREQPHPGEPGSLDEQIRVRAYEIYVARGRTPGHEVEDWLQAERELHRKA